MENNMNETLQSDWDDDVIPQELRFVVACHEEPTLEDISTILTCAVNWAEDKARGPLNSITLSYGEVPDDCKVPQWSG